MAYNFWRRRKIIHALILTDPCVLNIIIHCPCFLTGATGFLGVHLLFDLLENSKATIYCLIRAENREEAESRLAQYFKRYFPEATFPKGRIVVLSEDLSLDRLGLNEQDYHLIAQIQI